MSSPSRDNWEHRHRGHDAGGAPEPFVQEVLSLLPRRGLALDVAAGRGRHSLAFAAHGLSVVAVDYSQEAMRALAQAVHRQSLAIWPVVADLDNFSIKSNAFDLIANVNYLDRKLFPRYVAALKPGGMLLADTFLIDQAEIGHPRNPDFLLKHHELRALMGDLEIIRYREGLTVYPDETRAWRASALAVKRGSI
jgi:tellurite methyltransferase